MLMIKIMLSGDSGRAVRYLSLNWFTCFDL